MAGSPLPLDPAQYKEMVREDWKMAAPGWRKWTNRLEAQGKPITEALIRASSIRSGMNVLDIACGTGDPALTLARIVAPTGHVTATDLTAGMVEIAQERSRTLGLTNIHFKQADSEALPFADGSFEAVTCRFGIMFFTNREKSLREILRVLKPGGRATFAAWGPREQNPWFDNMLTILTKYAGLPPPPPEMPHPFNFSTPGILGGVLKASGFKDVKEENLQLESAVEGSPREAWEAMRDIAPPIQKALKAVPLDQQSAMVEEIVTSSKGMYDGKRLRFRMAVNLGTGVR